MPHRIRKRQRMQFFDYSLPGWYFVTICTKNREHIFGTVEHSETIQSDLGKMADEFWLSIPVHFRKIVMDEYIIMPNHLHGIVIIKDGNCIPRVGEHHAQHLRKIESTLPEYLEEVFLWDDENPRHKLLSRSVGNFKAALTRDSNRLEKEFCGWQRSFHDRVIRNAKELINIRNYIRNNPKNWETDIEYLTGTTPQKKVTEAYYERIIQ